MIPALFDTNILIDYLSGVDLAFQEVSKFQDRAISLMTWMEIMVGAKPDREAERRAVLNMFELLP